MKLKAVCRMHDQRLNGDLYCVPDGEYWQVDTSEMECPAAAQDEECQDSWSIYQLV